VKLNSKLSIKEYKSEKPVSSWVEAGCRWPCSRPRPWSIWRQL